MSYKQSIVIDMAIQLDPGSPGRRDQTCHVVMSMFAFDDVVLPFTWQAVNARTAQESP